MSAVDVSTFDLRLPAYQRRSLRAADAPTAGIFGVGAALPDKVVPNASLIESLDTTDEWIVKRTGIRQRRRLDDNATLTTLAAHACERALADAHVDPGDVDRVLVATITPDTVTPGLAPGVAAELGARGAAAVDLNAACAGFLYALDHAAALIERRRADVIVVCGADALSRLTDTCDRSTAALFGDGAGAVVVAGGELELGLAPFELGSDGGHTDLLYARTDERKLRMQGREVYRHAVQRMSEALQIALDRAGLSAGDLDLLVAHQANARILAATAERLGVEPDRVMVNIDQVANTSAASIPIALAQAEHEGRLRCGARIGLAAFGAGFVWAAGVISWKERAHVCA